MCFYGIFKNYPKIHCDESGWNSIFEKIEPSWTCQFLPHQKIYKFLMEWLSFMGVLIRTLL
jgi:hypothetical protein